MFGASFEKKKPFTLQKCVALKKPKISNCYV